MPKKSFHTENITKQKKSSEELENESTEEAATTSRNDMQGHVFSVPATEAKGHSVKKHEQVIKEQDKKRKDQARENDLQ